MALILTGSSGSTTLDSSAGLTFSDSSNQSAASSPYVLKNRLINGGMDIWQRGTTFSLLSSYAYGSADRWLMAFGGVASNNGIGNQVASGLTGFQYALKIGRNSGVTSNGQLIAVQALETVNSIPLAGQTVTLSFYAKAGANFSGNAYGGVGAIVYTGTGTDQAASSIGSWTGSASPISGTQTVTTSWVRYSFTGTISSTATQVGVFLYYNTSGTAGADDNLYITGVQLEVGSTATPFERRLYNQELANCQRYYWQINSAYNGFYFSGFCTSTTSFRGTLQFPQTMRANPTFTSSSASSFFVQTSTINAIPSNFSGTSLTSQIASIIVNGFTNPPSTGQAGLFIDNGGTYLGFSSEL
jgi:hypothetical protein